MNPFFSEPNYLLSHSFNRVRSSRKVILSGARSVGLLGIKGLVSWGRVATDGEGIALFLRAQDFSNSN